MKILSPFQRAQLVLLVSLLLWGVWRQQSLQQLERRVGEEEAAQRRFLSTLSLAAQDTQPLPPDPKPDTAEWLAANAFRGPLERRLIQNVPAAGGAGADVKLRNLKPEEVVRLFQQLTKVNLIVRKLVLSDLGSRSLWEVQLVVQTPQSPGGGQP